MGLREWRLNINMPIKEFFITIKSCNNYYRFLKCEEGIDNSFYIRHILSLHAKSSYHSNRGKRQPPYEYHLYGCAGNKILDSISQRKKFITEYRDNFFSSFHFDKLEHGGILKNLTKEDIVFDLKNKIIVNFSFDFFSDYRSDLLKEQFDNAIVKKISLIGYNLIIGLFWKPKDEK